MKRPFKVLRQHIIKNLFRLFFILLFITISSCGDGYDGPETGSSGAGETGSYSFSLKWPDEGSTLEPSSYLIQADSVPPPINCTANGVETVTVDFYDESNNYLVGDSFPCSDHNGTIHDIDAGNNRRLVVTGENSSGHELFWAQRTGISIIADQTTVSDTEIEMERLVSLFGTMQIEEGRGIAVDQNGNVYITGRTSGDLFDTKAGGDDIIISKYYSNGSWTRQFGTTDDDWANGIAVDQNGNAYITGYTYGNLDGNINAGQSDIFVSKYDTNGNKKWTRLLGTTSEDVGFGIAVDKSGNVYITGGTKGDLDGNTNAGYRDIFVSKYDTNGNKKWTRQSGGAGYYDDCGRGVAVDTYGNVYITGYAYGDLDGETNPLTTINTTDVFVSKYDANGNRQWTRLLGETNVEEGWGISVDPQGNAYITGYAGANVAGQVDMGGYDILVSKYDTNGNRQWIRLLGTGANDYGYGIAVDTYGSSYITGRTGGDLGGKTNAGTVDIFVTKYDTNGTIQSTKLFGTPNDDIGIGIAVDSNGNAYITGETYGSFGGIPNSGSGDIFILKLPSP